MLARRAGVPLCALMLAAIPAAAALAAQAPQSAGARETHEDELLLIEARLDNRLLSSELNAYQQGQRVLLPLGELTRLLGLAIETAPAAGQARGYVLQEQRHFHLDVHEARVSIAGQESRFEPEQVLLQDDDIYVDTRLLMQWLPVDLRVDFSALAVDVVAREPLPLQERLAREQRGRRLGAGGKPGDEDYQLQKAPYKMWDFPTIDLSLGATTSRHDGRQSTQGQASALVTGDLLGMESAIFLTHATGGQPAGSASPSKFRMTLGRTDPEGRLLGPLRAREFGIGSVAMPQLANIARAGSIGNGFGVSNAPLSQTFGSRSHSLQGNLPPGWDVELYFNGALVGFQGANAAGRYLFPDLPLVYGANSFRLVFNGPQGQQRVEERTVMLDPSLVRKGEFLYRVVGQEDDKGQRRLVAQMDLGLSSQASLSSTVASLPVDGKDRLFVGVGAQAQWLSSFWSADLIHSEGGVLGELAVQTRLRGVSVGLSHAQRFGDFASEEFLPTLDPVRSRDKVRLDWGWAPTKKLRLPVTVETKIDRLQSGQTNVEASARVSASLRRAGVSHQTRWQSQGGHSSLDGNLQVSTRFDALGVRGLVGYRLNDGPAFTTGGVLMDYSLRQGWRAHAGVSRMIDTRDTQLNAGLTKTLGKYGLRLDVGHSGQRGTTVGVQFLVSMSKAPSRGWSFSATPAGDSGHAAAKVFWDKNLNGIEDAGDEPLPGVGFTVNGSQHAARTDGRGSAHLSRLPARQYANIGIDVSSIEDPQLQPKLKGARILPRRGKTQELSFAVIATSEVDGTIYLASERDKKGLGGVAVELVDERGTVVGRATTASDGFYIIEGVPPGSYELRVAEQSLQARGLGGAGRRTVTVSPQADTVSGMDFAVLPGQETLAASPVPAGKDETSGS